MKVDIETLVCAFRGHATPGATVRALSAEEAGFGVDVAPTWRFSRCLRCDAWVGRAPPVEPQHDRLPEFEELDRPRRGKALREAVLLRVIAVERGIHGAIFTIIALLVFFLRTHLAAAQSWVQRLVTNLSSTEAQTGRANNHGFLSREGTKFLHLRSGTLEVLFVTAVIYAVLESTEAVGLWYEKRWAEYLTVLATAGFLPFEVDELAKKVTVVRVGALVVNLAIVVYLVCAKHLFGVGRGRAERERIDPATERAVFAPPY